MERSYLGGPRGLPPPKSKGFSFGSQAMSTSNTDKEQVCCGGDVVHIKCERDSIVRD